MPVLFLIYLPAGSVVSLPTESPTPCLLPPLVPAPSLCLQDDLERVRLAGGGRVDITVGSALDIFGGTLPYSDVVAWHQRQQQA